MASSAPFDPFTQTFTLLLADSTPFNITIPQLDEFVLYNVQICINYAAQLGASLVVLVILLLLTKADKRSSPIFFINLFSLALNFIRNVLFCLYFTGPFSETYAFFGQDYSRVSKSNYAQSITATVLSFLLLVLVEVSLILQVRVVCVTIRHIYKLAIFVASNIIALTAIGMHFAFAIQSSRSIIALTPQTSLNWLESATNITTTISICWFCTVFVTKLGFALNERRKLGLNRFGPMQVIFIMGCQTLIIPGKPSLNTLPPKSQQQKKTNPSPFPPPAIFSIVQYIAHVPELASNVLTLVAIFLPLSSLWASATTARSPASPTPPNRRTKFFWTLSSGSSAPLVTDKILLGSPLSPVGFAQRTSQLTIPSGGHADLDRDLEAQGLGAGVVREKF